MREYGAALRQRTEAFYAGVDTDDSAAFPEHLHADAVFRFNSTVPVPGMREVQEAVDGWKANFAKVTHEITDLTIDQSLGQVGVELVVTYSGHDGGQTIVKGASFLTFQGDLIKDWRVYVDTSGLG
ncbi:nuclear transport factor 2 family protein [Ornithinimicrobium cavernae]|uniref:nuclear transport factor 2 family protein n=1 Tax=Ornithinimicrobium cavernae TaxID=2666047 RepID=UPI000D69144D|nr:nuclear transport factor 2 family protein [Ornithinimicrobium cavernae]